MDIRIEQADGGTLRRHAAGVGALVRDAVESGASIGFVLPLGDDVLAAYAEQVAAEVDDGSRIVVLALDGDEVVGMVHLGLVKWPNGRHRADLQKLIVHTSARRRGHRARADGGGRARRARARPDAARARHGRRGRRGALPRVRLGRDRRGTSLRRPSRRHARRDDDLRERARVIPSSHGRKGRLWTELCTFVCITWHRTCLDGRA